MSATSIRIATPQDAPHIAQLHIATWQAAYKNQISEDILGRLSMAQKQQEWHELLTREVTVLVLEREHQIIGFASLCGLRDKSLNLQDCGEISSLYLSAQWWRQGLGKKLCLAACEKLREQAYSQVAVWVFDKNQRAQKFYKALGFTSTLHTKSEMISANDSGCCATINEICYIKTNV